MPTNYPTEAEAKKKWCPFSRTGVLAGNGAVAVNRHCSDNMPNVRDRLITDETRCIASACMAWRSITVLRGGDERGFCGLAGGGAANT